MFIELALIDQPRSHRVYLIDFPGREVSKTQFPIAKCVWGGGSGGGKTGREGEIGNDSPANLSGKKISMGLAELLPGQTCLSVAV